MLNLKDRESRCIDRRQMLEHYPSAVRGVMRFHLVYHGALPSAGNKSKPDDVLRIRQALSPQLGYLWKTHNALQVLQNTAALEIKKPLDKMNHINQDRDKFLQLVNDGEATIRNLAHHFPDDFKDLIQSIFVVDKEYAPLIRKSLDLACEIEIMFLRQQDPGQLITQGGDIDGRIKTLLDALRIPTKDEQDKNPPCENTLWCLLENDSLVSDLSIETDRLLFPETTRPNEVHLIISVRVNVLRVGEHNVCLL